MKRAILTLCLAFGAIFATQAQTAPQTEPDPNAPILTFDTETIDYGTIEQNADGVRYFTITNTGKSNLVISRCKGSCGCTVPTCPTEPIEPGASAKIKVKYATNRIGPINKTVTVSSNSTTPVKTVKIKGQVNAKPKPEPTPTNTNTDGDNNSTHH